jgi:hypothetical protein
LSLLPPPSRSSLLLLLLLLLLLSTGCSLSSALEHSESTRSSLSSIRASSVFMTTPSLMLPVSSRESFSKSAVVLGE